MLIAQAIDTRRSLRGAVGAGRVHVHQGDSPRPLHCWRTRSDLQGGQHSAPVSVRGIPARCLLSRARTRRGALPLLEQAVEHATAMRRMVEYSQWTFWLAKRSCSMATWIGQWRLPNGFSIALTVPGARSPAWTLRLLRDICVERGDDAFEQAESYYRQSMALAQSSGCAHCRRDAISPTESWRGLAGRRDEARARLCRRRSSSRARWK